MKSKTARRFLARNSWKLAKIKMYEKKGAPIKNSLTRRAEKASKVIMAGSRFKRKIS